MNQLVLSVCTGAGLLDRSFEKIDRFMVVSLGDILLGHDLRHKHIKRGFFDGLIGGPPCQWASKAKGNSESKAMNLIPDFMRTAEEGDVSWFVMENVDTPDTREYMSTFYPKYSSVVLRDWDCGGKTNRIRRFWFKGLPPCPIPPTRPGNPVHSVLATSWKYRPHKDGMHSAIDPNAAAYLQGYPNLAHEIICALPDAIPNVAKQRFATHLIGNGVPSAMGTYIAEWIDKLV